MSKFFAKIFVLTPMIELTLSGSLSIHMKFFGVPKAHSTRHSLNLGKHKSSTKPAISTALKWLFTSNDSRNHNQKQKSGFMRYQKFSRRSNSTFIAKKHEDRGWWWRRRSHKSKKFIARSKRFNHLFGRIASFSSHVSTQAKTKTNY